MAAAATAAIVVHGMRLLGRFRIWSGSEQMQQLDISSSGAASECHVDVHFQSLKPPSTNT